MEINIYKETKMVYNHNGKKIREIDGNLVDLIGLEGMVVHEILEKLTQSLRRKLNRYRLIRGHDNPINTGIFTVVKRLRHYFPEDYTLRKEVDEVIEAIENEKSVI